MHDARSTPRTLATAYSRCTGALFFSVFGCVWLLFALVYFHHFHWLFAALITATGLGFVAGALRTQRQIGDGANDAYPEAEKKSNDRHFFILNGVMYAFVFLLFLILPRMGASNYVFPAFVFLVGLHFVPMPPLYRHRANTTVGLLMMAWAITCVALFHHDGEREAAWVTMGAGILLWAAAAFALRTAASLLQRTRATANTFYT